MLKKLVIILSLLGSFSGALGASFPIVDGQQYCGLVLVQESKISPTGEIRKTVTFKVPPPPPVSHTFPELIFHDAISEKHLLSLITQGKLNEYAAFFDVFDTAFSLTPTNLEVLNSMNDLNSGDKVCLKGLAVISGFSPGSLGTLLPNDPNPESGPKYVGGTPPRNFYGIQVLEINVIK